MKLEKSRKGKEDYLKKEELFLCGLGADQKGGNLKKKGK